MNDPVPVLLAVSASGGTVTVAARRGDRIASADAPAGRGGGDVATLVARVMTACDARPDSIAGIVVDRGPGSYTGLRVALTFTRTLATFRAFPIAAVTSVEAIALAAWRHGDVDRTRPIRVVLDARRDHHHVALLALRDGRVVLLEPPSAVPAGTTNERIDAEADVVSEATLFELLREVVDRCGVRLVERRAIDAADLLGDALVPRVADPATLEPLYLLASYAEA